VPAQQLRQLDKCASSAGAPEGGQGAGAGAEALEESQRKGEGLVQSKHADRQGRKELF